MSGTTLTAVAARDLARTWFEQRDPARARNDDRTLKSLETADAFRVEQGLTQQILCGCEVQRNLHHLQSVSVLVPAAPVRAFVAQFKTSSLPSGIPGSYTAVFVARSGGWRAAIVALNDPEARTFHPRPAGPGNSKNPAYARRLLNQFGEYLYTARTTGHKPPSPGRAWIGLASAAVNSYIELGQDRPDAHGISTHSSIATATSAYAFRVAEGRLVCGAITRTAVVTAPDGHVFVQDPARTLGPNLPPGNYRRVMRSYDTEVCLIVHPNGTRDVISFYGFQTNVTSTRAPRI